MRVLSVGLGDLELHRLFDVVSKPTVYPNLTTYNMSVCVLFGIMPPKAGRRSCPLDAHARCAPVAPPSPRSLITAIGSRSRSRSARHPPRPHLHLLHTTELLQSVAPLAAAEQIGKTPILLSTFLPSFLPLPPSKGLKERTTLRSAMSMLKVLDCENF